MVYKFNLDLVALHITSTCSHKCPFCYASVDEQEKKQTHGNFDKIKKVIDALHLAETKEINLLGGDPACHPRVIDIAKHASSLGIDVSILSNTLYFNGYSEKEVSKFISSFESTIHHVVPDMHDKFCKKHGAYQNITKQLKIFSDLGKKTGVALNITPETAEKLFDLVSRLIVTENIPLDYVIVQRIIPQGRAKSSSEFTITKTQAVAALKEIKKIKEEFGINIAVEDPFPLCILPQDLQQYMVPCQWGITKASVNSDGDLSRCGADPRYRLGNILKTPLLEIWNNSPILDSFRKKSYLPGYCRVCEKLNQCSGGCPLSCQIDEDHGIDYIYIDHEKLFVEIHGEVKFSLAREEELSSLLLIEWGNFAQYGHSFSVESIKKWFLHNPKMFYVIRDAKNWVLGFGTLVPITENLFKSIMRGQYSSLTEFPEKGVLRKTKTEYFHFEVLATIPSRISNRTGSNLVKALGYELIKKAKYVSASPISEIGLRLCEYFGFEHVSDQVCYENKYPIYKLTIEDKVELEKKLKKF